MQHAYAALRNTPVDNQNVPWWIGLKASAVLASFGVGVALLTYPRTAIAIAFFALAVVWMLVSARSRRSHRDARLRARAAADEREYQQWKL
ncbi:MAG TPA: hypothetical protein VH702_11850 [Vicinamibacterales bacterium]